MNARRHVLATLTLAAVALSGVALSAPASAAPRTDVCVTVPAKAGEMTAMVCQPLKGTTHIDPRTTKAPGHTNPVTKPKTTIKAAPSKKPATTKKSVPAKNTAAKKAPITKAPAAPKFKPTTVRGISTLVAKPAARNAP